MSMVIDTNYQLFLKEINKYPILSANEEFTVAKRYYEHKKEEDAYILVTSNLRYVLRIALEFRDYGFNIQDLFQEGCIGLMKAIKKFNPLKGFKLITYATWWIKAQIQSFIQKNKSIVSRSDKALRRQLFYKGNNEDKSIVVEFDDTFMLEADSEISPDTKHINGLLLNLNDKERFLVEKRIMTDEPMTYKEIGERLNISKQRANQIEKEALEKLRRKYIEE